MAEPTGDSARLDDSAVHERLSKLEELLEQVEAIPGPAGEVALEAVSALADVYGEALARATTYASAVPALIEEITRDELLGHLLVLHDIHPEPVEARVARALEDLRPAVQERGGDVELAGIDQGVAKIRLSVSGCGSSGLEDAIRETVLAVAPELSGVTSVPAGGRDAAFIPLDALLHGPVTNGARP